MTGCAVAFADVHRAWAAGDKYAKEIAQENTHDPVHDALSWYAGIFENVRMFNGASGMFNGASGADTLRHVAVLGVGLGVRESEDSNIGPDVTAGPETGEEAEAGIWQMSMNAFEATPLLSDLYAELSLRVQESNGLADVFYAGVKIKPGRNIGSGAAAIFQDRLKKRPLIAWWLMLLGLRYVGGSRGQWGPIRRHEVTLSPAVDDLLRQVQAIVDAEPAAAVA
jgi:hypothetical protein